MKVGDLVKWRSQKFIALEGTNTTMARVVNMLTGKVSSFPTHWMEVISESR